VRPPFDPRPVTLARAPVRLEPLAPSHAGDLLAAGAEESIWPWMPRGPLADLADTTAWIEACAEAADRGEIVPFAIIDAAAGRAVGSTRFMDIRRPHRALEIGYTWLGVAAQRSAVNTTCKLLLMEHAFETLGAERVQLKTDARNERSQRALERIGAVREGVLRRHMVVRDGYVRDSVYYSVVAGEWEGVRERLEALLRR
jgi:RimJ/RimL family protein N-acetyltransferase